jgi:hypothetical protein
MIHTSGLPAVALTTTMSASSRPTTETLTRDRDAGVHLAHDVNDHGDEKHQHHGDGADDRQHQAELRGHLAPNVATKAIAVTARAGCRPPLAPRKPW